MRLRRVLVSVFPALLILLATSAHPQSGPAVQSTPATKSSRAPNASTLPAEPAGAERCKFCHAAEVEGYSLSAMAHSLRRASNEPAGMVSTTNAKISMHSSQGTFWQSLESAGQTDTYRIDYVIGSGNHASGYLVDIANHLFQSPVAFYKSRNAYDLAPGYEKTADPDFTRPIEEGCLFCHSGTSLHVRGTDNLYRKPIFPRNGEAVTCERCHGPSEAHLADPRAGTIINPAKLEPAARDSVCEQCHLFGAARVLNPGREFSDFRAGQRLEDIFTTYHNVLPPGAPRGAFKVISQVEELALSTCARSSEGRLWCGTCHDPHNKPADAAAYYRSKCLTCHTSAFPQNHPSATSDCISCHMPRRAAQDGGHTAFTDHRIQRRPEPEQEQTLPASADIAAWREPSPDLQKRNLGIADITVGLQRRSSDYIIRGYRLLTEVQQDFASDPQLFGWLGTALGLGNQPSEAEVAFERAIYLQHNSPVLETQDAGAHQKAGDTPGAISHLERAVAIDPFNLPASTLLVSLYQQQGEEAKAETISSRIRSALDEQKVPLKSAPLAANAESVKSAEAVFKNIEVLKGVPADQVRPAMRFIAASLGVECNFCHVAEHFDSDDKKPKQTARAMMRMEFAINDKYFGGERRVTCYSCHQGAAQPVSVPALDVAAAAPRSPQSAGGAELAPGDLQSGDVLLAGYLRAVGGNSALASVASSVASGNEQVNGKSSRVEIFSKVPGKIAFVRHTPGGDDATILDGDAGWQSVHGLPPRELERDELLAAYAEAAMPFALNLRETFPEMRPEYPVQINGSKAYVVDGIREGRGPWKFYFDAQSGLLVRLICYSESPLGLLPTQIDYGDYRQAGELRVPFRWTISSADSIETIQLDEIRQNVPVDDAAFARPTAVKRSAN